MNYNYNLNHLSHTDIDGYACQFVSNFYFKNCYFYNSNYGKEINDNFSMILDRIDESLKLDSEVCSIVLISDLNLSLSQCESFEEALSKRSNAKIFLLDHHQSGQACAEKYAWYFLDSSRCATKIVYDFFSKMFFQNENLAKFVDVVNAIDIWLKDDTNFELGKVLLSMVSNAKELNRVLFPQKNTEYMFFLLSKAQTFVGKDKAHILFEDSLHFLKKEFFKDEENNTLGNLLSTYVVKILNENKEYFTLKYKEYKFLLTYNIGNVSVIGNDFLTLNKDYDFFLDVNSKKTLSFRSNNKVDVSLIAQTLVGGGGHKNASGGFFAAFKDSSDYSFIKNQILDLIKSKEEKSSE